MEKVTVNPQVAKRMLGRAFLKVVENRAKINEINEFPVPDKDTGTNMYVTIGGALAEVWNKEYGLNFQSFCDETEDSLLVSISGNAGTISAAFLSGFLRGLAPYTSKPLGGRELYQGFLEGKERAFKSVHDPKEGTMLDVIHEAENAALMYIDQDVEGMFIYALHSAKADLPHTMERNPVLKKAGVIDAGALGFVLLLEGLYEGMFNNEEVELPEEVFTMGLNEEVLDINEETNLLNPYEVQFILEPSGGVEELNEFTHELRRLGDSLDIFSTADMSSIRAHIHTNNVEAVQRLTEKCGDTSHVRVIDMRDEIRAKHGEKRKIMIITDGGADLPWEALAKGVFVVPFKLNFPERRNLAGSFYEKMLTAKEWPSTSQPSVGTFTKNIKDALRLAEEVVVITTSSKLSGSHNSAIQAINSLNERDRARVMLFDSAQAACGQALVVHKAIELTQAGKSTLEILGWLNELTARIRLLGYPRDIEYLVRGGRLKGGLKTHMARLMQKLNFHPRFALGDGIIREAGIKFGGDFAGKLSDCASASLCAISYAGSESEASKLKRLLEERDNKVLFVEQLNRIIGVHTGPALILAWYKDD